MFSVTSSPYNSLPRQLYGGWTTGITSDTADAAAAGWNADGAQYFKDTKWASMAEKYAVDPKYRDLAAHIRKISKDVLKGQRALAKTGDPGAVQWMAAYNRAAKNIRSKLRLPPLTYGQKEAVWDRFSKLGWKDDFDETTRSWFTLASRAPYVATPSITGVTPQMAAEFVAPSATYAAPSKMSLSTRQLLALARGNKAIGTVAAEAAANKALQQVAQNAYTAAISYGIPEAQARAIASGTAQQVQEAAETAAPTTGMSD